MTASDLPLSRSTDVGSIRIHALEAGLPILGGFRQMPLFFQNRLHQATLGRIVIDDQYGLGHHTHAFSVAYLFGAIL